MNKDHWQKSLHLPKTEFPMKARLLEKEPEIINFWEKRQIYKKILEKRKNAKPFFLPDGPPYSNGPIHIGHALNKILKDIVIKYKNLKGFKTPFLPAWDCHGLPIELKALKEISKKNNKPSAKDLRQACRKTARFWMEKQQQSFKRLGVMADWNNSFLTMDPNYEAEEIRAFAKIAGKKLIFRGVKPVLWCCKLKTALAFSEAEYRDHKSPSIYVKFYLDERGKKTLGSSKPVCAVIWTTTPWTLPANSAICLHPDLEYRLYESKTEFYLLAVGLAESFFKETELTNLKPGKLFKGKDLEGLISLHPFIERNSPLVLAHHVSLEAGTGLVHTAPGHGLEDHLVGKKYRLEERCPVDEKGHFSQDLPAPLKGLFIFKGNKVIIEMLKNSRHLISEKEIQHSYPYNPRSNFPLIYRLTPQWFLSLDKKIGSSKSIREQALTACKKSIHFIPAWGRARLEAMIQASPDWCLSRQRVWGAPLVVFYCKHCSQPVLDPKIIESIANKMEETGQGIEYYFSTEEKYLLPESLHCKSCGSKDFKKGEDILDVWFDSGIQHAFLTKNKACQYPADLFLEGSDQHRGWFQTSLLSSLALSGDVPFKTLLTHGFVNDAQGRKMSKSKGNVLEPEQLIESAGAEIIRLWVASENCSLDLSAGRESFHRLKESYRRFRNTFRFLLGNLQDFDLSKNSIPFKNLNPADKWTLRQLNNLIRSGTEAYERFAFHRLYQQLNHFFTVDLSAFYLDIIKDRLYTFPAKSNERRKAQTVLYHLLDNLLSLMAPITSFLCEEVYGFFAQPDKKESVFLKDFPKEVSEWKNEGVSELFAKLFLFRDQINKRIEALREEGKIGSSIQAEAKLILKKDFISPVLNGQERLEFFGLSRLVIEEGKNPACHVFPAKGEKCPRCWFISKSLGAKGLCPKCEKHLHRI